MDDIFNSIITMFPDPNKRLNVLINAFKKSGYDEITQSISQSVNESTYSVIRLYCLAYIANTIPYIEFQSSNDAFLILEELKSLFEAQFKITDDSDIFDYLQTIYIKIIADISARGTIMPDINYFYCEKLPLPVVSQYLYQDGSRDNEILLRNNSKIRHPLFYTGQLEVLSE